VPNLDEALAKLRLRPLHASFRAALSEGNCNVLTAIAEDLTVPPPSVAPLDTYPEPTIGDEVAESVDPNPEAPGEPAPLTPAPAKAFVRDPRLDGLLHQAKVVFQHAVENMHTTGIGSAYLTPKAPFDEEALQADLLAAAHLPSMLDGELAGWPAAARLLLPTGGSTWAPVLAWMLLRSLPSKATSLVMFDLLMIRMVLAESFGAMGMHGDSVWRAAARVRILVAYAGKPSETLISDAFWTDPDVRWLTGVNVSEGKTWFNLEQFEEMAGWLQVPALVAAIEGEGSIAAVGDGVTRLCDLADESGYDLTTYLKLARARPEEAEG
jgi:hypothetical protein